MARRRLKLTPFARFLILMIFAAPLAYMGASYYNGQDGLENLKKLLRLDQPRKTETVRDSRPSADRTENTLDLQAQVEALTKRIETLEQQNDELRGNIKQKEVEIKELKRQVRVLQGSD